ncbi:MAG: PD40 domain-containing protein [Oligoflexales bacterium]|nr:PD40 domain-containing protein [Oligoflexales bacterium]
MFAKILKSKLFFYWFRWSLRPVSVISALLAVSAEAAEPFVVKIDSPSFRKLTVALPEFDAGKETDAVWLSFAQQGKADFESLFRFTGLFNLLNISALPGLPAMAVSPSASLPSEKKVAEPNVPQPIHIPAFSDVDVASWRALGAESLTLVKFEKQDTHVRVEIRTADLNQLKLLLSRSYTITISKENLFEIEKQYLDDLLLAYTGRPGIFQSKIVFLGRSSMSVTKQLYTCDVLGQNLKQLTKRDTSHLSPTWDPSGKTVVFSALENKKGYFLFSQDLLTGRTNLLSGFPVINSGGNISPQGQFVVYSAYDLQKKETQLYVLSLQNSRNRRLLYAYPTKPFQNVGVNLVDPSFSPDGKWLAYVSDQYGNPHIFRQEVIWSRGASDLKLQGEEKRLTYAGWFNTMPTWSPDSKKIAFAGLDKEIRRFDLFLMNSDGTQLERLTLERGDNESPSFSKNGLLIIFQSNRIGDSNSKGPAQLYLMNRDGTDQRKINTGLYSSESPEWGP